MYVDPTGHLLDSPDEEPVDYSADYFVEFGNEIIIPAWEFVKPNEVDVTWFQAGGPAGVETGAAGYFICRILGKETAEKLLGKALRGADSTWNSKIKWPNKPHINRTPGHWETIVNKAEELAKSDDVVEVYMNKGLSNVQEINKIDPNRRPDIMVVRKNGKIDQYEIPSETDDVIALMDRMTDNQRILGDIAGNIYIIPIK